MPPTPRNRSDEFVFRITIQRTSCRYGAPPSLIFSQDGPANHGSCALSLGLLPKTPDWQPR